MYIFDVFSQYWQSLYQTNSIKREGEKNICLHFLEVYRYIYEYDLGLSIIGLSIEAFF